MFTEKHIIVPIIHGVEFGEDFQAHYLSDMYDFIKAVQNYIPPDKRQQIHFRPIEWNHLVADKEKSVYNDFLRDNFWRILAKVSAFGICDVLWYAPPRRTPVAGDLSYDIEDLIRKDIENCQNVYGPDSEIVLIGHSLGTQIALDFCFDGFIIDGLITIGSPILLWSGRYHNWGEPPEHLKFWVNFRSKFDPVATVISRNPNPAFTNLVKEVDTTSWWNFRPLSAHTNYWKQDKVHKEIASALLSIL